MVLFNAIMWDQEKTFSRKWRGQNTWLDVWCSVILHFICRTANTKFHCPESTFCFMQGPFCEMCDNWHFNSFSRHWAWFNGAHFCHIKKKIMLWQLLINNHNYEIKKTNWNYDTLSQNLKFLSYNWFLP